MCKGSDRTSEATRKTTPMLIKLNAFHKDSSACYSKVIDVETRAEYEAELATFESEVKFSRWYPDHENLDGAEIVDGWIED